VKARKKHVGTGAQIRTLKEKERRIGTAIFLALILLIIIISAYLTYTFLNQSQDQTINPASSQLKAAIVDHLSLTCPNQTFIEAATSTLKKAGYTVDYYPGEKVNVEFYRNLPTHYYALIILRVHSGLQVGDDPPVVFFTSEPYSKTKYIYEQLTDQVWEGQLGTGFIEGQTYFGISPEFVEKGMSGRFEDTAIVMMGCNGLTYTDMAGAFIQRGAKVYISWSESVLAGHTDQATTQLLKHLLTGKQTIEQAVTETMKEVGPDPAYKSLLSYYPLEVGEQTIENIKNNG
jgi:hypothetical protein